LEALDRVGLWPDRIGSPLASRVLVVVHLGAGGLRGFSDRVLSEHQQPLPPGAW
jgi:hypothetical protein